MTVVIFDILLWVGMLNNSMHDKELELIQSRIRIFDFFVIFFQWKSWSFRFHGMPVFLTSLSRCSTFFVPRKPLVSPTLFALAPSTTTACAHTGTVFVDALAPAFVVPWRFCFWFVFFFLRIDMVFLKLRLALSPWKAWTDSRGYRDCCLFQKWIAPADHVGR